VFRFRYLSIKSLFAVIAFVLYLIKLFWLSILIVIVGIAILQYTGALDKGFYKLSNCSYKQTSIIGVVIAFICFGFLSALNCPAVFSFNMAMVAWWATFTFGMKLKVEKQKNELKKSGVVVTEETNVLTTSDVKAVYISLFSLIGIVIITFVIYSAMPDEYWLKQINR
jgi:hypothetical protein